MTSKPSLSDLLTSTEFDDLVGPIHRNVADGLFAIANAINRLAAISEHVADQQAASTEQMMERQREMRQMFERMAGVDHDHGGGHA